MMNTHTKTVDLGLAETGLDSGCRDCGGASSRHDGCGCGGKCSGGSLERPRWFAGQLVGPGDLEALQSWIIGRARRHNRMIHGWGVSCGLAVTTTVSPTTGDAEPWSVTVGEGFAISGCGDDISVPTAVRIDIRQPRPSGSEGCAPPVDPWCAPVRARREPERTYYLAIRYAEEHRRPVRAGGCGCGCDDDPCEFSRIAETYTLAVLDELPECYDDTGREPAPESSRGALGCTPEIRERGTRACPDCCSPWVVLADLRVDSAGTVTIDPLTHRRFLPALGELAFTCAPVNKVQGIRFNEVEKDLMVRVFSAEHAAFAEADRDAVGAAPAVALRGAGTSNALRSVVADRTVAELANMDLAALRVAVIRAGGEPAAIERVHAMATTAMRLAGHDG